MPAKKTVSATEAKSVAKEEVKKPVAKKEPVKKATAAKKAATTTKKKTTTKKATTKKVEKKGEAHAMDWLYIEVNAGDLLTEVEAGVDNLSTTCQAILNCMLEGDGFIVEPSEADKVNTSLTVRYYCDNLSEDRKKYFER